MKLIVVLMFLLAAIVVTIGEKVAIYHFCVLAAFLVILGYMKLMEKKDE